MAPAGGAGGGGGGAAAGGGGGAHHYVAVGAGGDKLPTLADLLQAVAARGGAVSAALVCGSRAALDECVKGLRAAPPGGAPAAAAYVLHADMRAEELTAAAEQFARHAGRLRAEAQARGGGAPRPPRRRGGPPPGGGGGGPGRGPLRDDPPEVGSVHRGAVHAVKPFGVFVVIPGFRRRGLVPLHQVSAYLSVPREASDEEKVAALSEALGSDPEVWFKVVEVQPDDGDGRGAKVACSIKNVAQHDGRDLDPHNLNYRPRGGGDAGRGGRGGADPGTLPAAHQLAGFAREEMALRVKGPAKGGRGEGYELLLEPEGGEEGAGPPPPRDGGDVTIHKIFIMLIY